MSELKNCPCCASEDIVEGSRQYYLGEDIYIQCRTCGLKMQICSEYGWDELKKRWNTRKSVEEAMKRLQEELELAITEVEIMKTHNSLQFDRSVGYMNGIDNAIEFIKEEMM